MNYKERTDRIIIEDLEIFANHGVLEEENRLGQKFLLCIELFLDSRRAGTTDNLKFSVDYSEVCHFVVECFKARTFKLIESAAESVALSILAKYGQIENVKVTVKKPWAPIGLSLSEVAVTIERGWHIAYLGIGSNMGDKLKYLEDAVSAIKDNPNCKLLKISDIIVTEPYGPVEQEDFLNGALMVKTLYTPIELLRFLQKLESMANRVREVHWGPRTLDLDILLYDDLVTDEEELVLPHPEMHKRAFVLEPLKQIAPNVVHPLLRQRIRDMI